MWHRRGRRGRCCRRRHSAARVRPKTRAHVPLATTCMWRRPCVLPVRCTSPCSIRPWFSAAAPERKKTPPRASRRGDWYARKETQRGDETGTTRPRDAPRRSAFALCHPFKMITSLPAVGNCRYYSKFRRFRANGNSPHAASRPLRTTSHQFTTRNWAD